MKLLFSFNYSGPRRNCPDDNPKDPANVALEKAYKNAEGIIRAIGLEPIHEYMWPDGSLYLKSDTTDDVLDKYNNSLQTIQDAMNEALTAAKMSVSVHEQRSRESIEEEFKKEQGL